jgi:hypothetical protein
MQRRVVFRQMTLFFCPLFARTIFFFCPLFARTIFLFCPLFARGSRQKITLTKKSGQICPRAKKTIPILSNHQFITTEVLSSLFSSEDLISYSPKLGGPVGLSPPLFFILAGNSKFKE